jgi:hypothetical protein
MINQTNQVKETRPTFSGRLLIVCILFFIPSAILVYSTIFLQVGLSGFVQSQIGGYIFFVTFAFIYIGVIKGITWLLARMGIRLR